MANRIRVVSFNYLRPPVATRVMTAVYTGSTFNRTWTVIGMPIKITFSRTVVEDL